MAIIKLNINSFKKNGGGILNKMVDEVTNKIEQKLENAVEDLIAGGLKKSGLSSSIAGEVSSRFGDAFAKGSADKYFKDFNSELNRVSPADIKNNMIDAGNAETYTDAINRTKNRIGGGAKATLQYPQHIGEYYISMRFAEYSRPAPESHATLDFKQAIILPIPREIKEQVSINIDDGAQQGQMGGLANLASGMFGSRKSGDVLDSQLGAMAYSAAVQLAGEGGQIISQFMGAVPNPHVQAIFSGVPLRTHRFDWVFAPRNEQESAALQDLVFALKAYSLPSYTRLGTAALQYPMLCQLDLYPWADTIKDDKSGKKVGLITFKPAFLRSVDINYSPQGMPAFFAGTNAPTMIGVSLEFVETEIHTSNDYGRQGNSNLDDNADKFYSYVDEKLGGGVTSVRNEVRDLLNDIGNK